MKKTKRFISLFMSALIAMSVFIVGFCSMTSYADDPIKEQTEAWDGMFGYRCEGDDAVITDCKKSSTVDVVIPSEINGHRVVKIGVGAFLNSDWMESLTIPNTVTMIGSYAFKRCFGLSSITIPDSVISISETAFNYCTGLRSIKVDENNKVYDSRNDCNAIIATNTNTLVYGCMNSTIPYDIVSIGRFAFCDCAGLKSITIPDGVKTIDDYAFSSCTGLASVIIPDSVTKIGYFVFNGCSGMTSVSIGNGVGIIGEYSFENCTRLTDVYFNGTEEQWNNIDIREGNDALNNPTRIPDGGLCGNNVIWTFDATTNTLTISGEGDMYSDCEDALYKKLLIKKVVVENGVTSIGDYAFSECTSIVNIEIADTVKEIGNGAFFRCINLMSADLPSGLTKIPESLFSRCVSIEHIEIPEGVQFIGQQAFRNCNKMKSIVIPKSVKTIEDAAFLSCTSLEDIYYTGSRYQWSAIEITSNNLFSIKDAKIHYYINDTVLGDVNEDDVINSTDALMVLQFAVGKITLTDSQCKAADVNNDLKANSTDALMILQYTVKQIEHF